MNSSFVDCYREKRIRNFVFQKTVILKKDFPMRNSDPTPAPSCLVGPIRSIFAASLLLLLLLSSLAAQAQDESQHESGGPINPQSEEQDPKDPGDGQDDTIETDPVYLTASVAPETVALTTGTATLTWAGENAVYCNIDRTRRSDSGTLTVGPWTTVGTKTIKIECWGIGDSQHAQTSVDITVTSVPAPTVTSTLSKSLLEAGVDKFTVTYSAANAKSCMLGGVKYPTSGSATLGPYAAGKHSLTFSCSGDGGETSHTINWEAISRVSVSAGASPSTVKANGADTARVSWTGANADSCALDGASAAKSGSKTFGPYSYSDAGAKSATVSCANRLGSKSATAAWTVEALPPAVSATLSKSTVTAGADRVDLSWTSANSDSCAYDNRSRATSGTIRNLGPFTEGDHSFTVSCTGKGGTGSATATLTAERAPDPPTVSVSLNPETITANTGTSTLSWSSTGATSCTRDSATVAVSGSVSVGPYPAGTHDFTVNCAGPGGNASGTATLTVEPESDPPTVTVTLNPERIAANTGTSTLSWSSRNAASCTRGGAAAATRGSVSVGPYPAGTRRFTVTCTGPGGTGSETASLVSVPPPTVAVSLSASSIEAGKDTVDLTWSSTGAASCEYGSVSLATSGKRTIGPFSAGTHDITVNCAGTGGASSDTERLTATSSDPDTDGDGTVDSEDTDDDNDGMPDVCEIKYGFNPLDASDGGATNTDGDGASNVHECKHGTDPTRTPANTVLPDTDGDGMHDAWELNNRLDPDDAADAQHDDDGDGHSNLEEFTARTDPQWDDSHPNSVPELQLGFNSSYTVQVGRINAGDALNDILVRNPTSGILPSVSDFVMIQKRGGGFEIKALTAEHYKMPIALTDISSKATVVDINGDGAKDLILSGLASGIAAIPGANDQIVYGNYRERYTIPERKVSFAPEVKKFFKELSAWVDDNKYFIKNAPKVNVPKVIGIDYLRDAQNNIIARRQGGGTEISLRGAASPEGCFDGVCGPIDRECRTSGSFFCYVFTGDPSDLATAISGSSCASAGITCTYSPTSHVVAVEDAADNPTEDNYEIIVKLRYSPTLKVSVRDFSAFNQDSYMLATRYLQPLKADDNFLVPATNEAEIISKTISAYLDADILNRRLLGVGKGVFPRVDRADQYSGPIKEILTNLEFLKDNLSFPSPQPPVAEKERANSPNLDAIPGLLKCTYELPCTEEDFTDPQKQDINTRLTELLSIISQKTYSSTDDAAKAIHNSGLHEFAKILGIEILVTIDDASRPVKITSVYTSFNTIRVELLPSHLGYSLWHNHPRSFAPIWQGDAANYANALGSKICSEKNDYTVYASSGKQLTKATIKQTIGISNPDDYMFNYAELQKNNMDWLAKKSAFSKDANEVDFDCP